MGPPISLRYQNFYNKLVDQKIYFKTKNRKKKWRMQSLNPKTKSYSHPCFTTGHIFTCRVRK
jgi:hypothetical protein